ncbi:MAG: hypothetical protein LBS19_13375, partial [Clostridiales bacterium]|nr:hypothetical protein [Clostridiales bacterium]
MLLTTILSVFASDVDAQYDAAISLMSITNAESQFKIIKEDENGNPMPGISYDFAFYHTGYQGYLFAGSITTGADGTAMSKDYVFGDFIITEHPIDGYEPNDPLDIVIDKVGVIEVRFSSVKLIQGSVHVSVTEGNGMGIEGAIISIYTSDGLLTADIITDSGGMASYDGLSKGGYYAVVNSVPPGYLGYTDQYPFRIENDGKIEMLEMIVESVSGHAKIIVNDNFGNPLPRAVYGVYDNRNNFLEELMTGADGTVTSGRLHYGNYELRELLTVDGYEPMPEPVPFSIAQNDVIVEIPISRTAITGKVRATKTDGGGVPIPGVRYGIYGNQNILIEELTTGSDGAAMSGTLRYGAYELRELEAVSGYVPMPEPIPFNITEKGVTVEIPISGELIMGSVRLLKTDGDGVPIPGVKLTLYNNAGQIIQEFITGADGTATSISLVKGDYYLIETESAPGYVPITEPIPFSITVHNEVVEKTVVNNPGIGTLRVIALGESAAENGKGLIIGVRGVSADYIPIPGAKFDVYRGFNDENIAELTTGDDGAAEIELPLGEYYLEETFIPPAYKLPENSFPVAIMEHQATYELPVHNELVPKQPENGFVELTKKSTAGEPLANAVFGLYDAAGEVQITTLTTDTEGEAAYELQPGEYYFVELSAPDGYVLNSERVSFFVASGETAAVTAFNEPDAPTPTQTGHIRLVKLMEGTGLFLEGAVFGVYEKGTDAQAGTLTTGEDGTATSAALPPAEYYLRELAAPAGFAPIPADVDVTVSAGNIAEIYIYNAPIPLTGYIRLTKLEEGTDRPLSGAVFGIYDASNDVRIAELATGADGAAVSGELAEGVYYLKEETVPDGYKVITEKMGVTVKGGETTEITIYNAKLPPHPPTTGFVRLTKKAEGTDAPLQGAVFGVYAVSGDIKTAELTTGADGTVTSGEL